MIYKPNSGWQPGRKTSSDSHSPERHRTRQKTKGKVPKVPKVPTMIGIGSFWEQNTQTQLRGQGRSLAFFAIPLARGLVRFPVFFCFRGTEKDAQSTHCDMQLAGRVPRPLMAPQWNRIIQVIAPGPLPPCTHPANQPTKFCAQQAA